MDQEQTPPPNKLIFVLVVLAIILFILAVIGLGYLFLQPNIPPAQPAAPSQGADHPAGDKTSQRQEPQLLDVLQFGSSEDDSALAMALDDHGIYILGETEGDLDGTNAGKGAATTPGQATGVGAEHTFGLDDPTDVFLEKYTLDGKTKLWGTQFGTDKLDSAGGVAINNSGVYVGGKTEGSLDGELSGQLDSYLRKYTPDGTLVWSRQLGTDNRDESEWVVANDDHVCIGGGTLGSFPGFHKQGNEDIFVRCYDNDGNELWTLQFGTPGFEETLGATADEEGIYVAGAVNDQIGDDPQIGQEDLWYGQISWDGKLLTTSQFGSKATDFGHGVAMDQDHVYVSGRAEGKLKGETAFGSSDAVIGAFEKASGSLAWVDQYGTASGDASNNLTADASGVYMIGTQNGKAEKHATNTATEDGFIRQYSPSGKFVWMDNLTTDDYDEPRDIVIVNNMLYVLGRTGGRLGNRTFGAWDGFLARYQLGSN